MERLIPEVLVNLLFPLATFQVWLNVEGHFPLDLFPTQQPRHHGLAVSLAVAGCAESVPMRVLGSLGLTQLMCVPI